MVKTVHIKNLSTIAMTTGGEKKYTKVIHNGILKEWVGIGWVDIRKATARDRATYPTVKE